MADAPRICYERFFRLAEETAGRCFWPHHAILTVAFLDGDPLIQKKVRSCAEEWMKYADIRLEFLSDPVSDAHIRISFIQQGSWSAVGMDALKRDLVPPGRTDHELRLAHAQLDGR